MCKYCVCTKKIFAPHVSIRHKKKLDACLGHRAEKIFK